MTLLYIAIFTILIISILTIFINRQLKEKIEFSEIKKYINTLTTETTDGSILIFEYNKYFGKV